MIRVAAFISLLALTSCASGDYYRDITETYIEGDRLYVSGTLNALTYDEIADHLGSSPELTTIVLVDIDGSIDDEVNLETGRLIHEAGVDTYVPAHGRIESGAVDLFCAGQNRIAETGALIGVHAWADEDGLEGGALPKSDPEHRMYIEYFEQVACPVSFYWFTLDAAPADGMHYMSEGELRAYAVATEIREAE